MASHTTCQEEDIQQVRGIAHDGLCCALLICDLIVCNKPCSHSMIRMRFCHDFRAIHDPDVIVRDSIEIWEFKPHLQFLVNWVYFDKLLASSVVLGWFLYHVNKTKKKEPLLNHLRHLVVWTNQRLLVQFCYSYHFRIAFESLMWMGFR